VLELWLAASEALPAVGSEAAEQRHEELLQQPFRLAARDLQQHQDRRP
jgi:hypothetical protein